jgi:hypothetical protein
MRARSANEPLAATTVPPAAIFVGGLLLAWLTLWATGWPLPNGDDGFYTGGAIHLVKTGVLANPWLAGWMQWIPGVHLDRYFIQPPFQPWVLAAWLKLFGISSASVTGFACLTDALAAWAGAHLLRRLGCSWPAATAAAAMISVYLLTRGLRTDAVGLLVLLAGQILLLAPGRTRWTLGCLLTMAACGVQAYLLTVATPVLLLHLGIAWFRGAAAHDYRDLRAKLARSLVAALAVGLLFLLAIKGELAAFLHDFLGHARTITPPPGHKLASFLQLLTVGFEIVPNLFVLGVSVLGIAYLGGREPRLRPALWAGGATLFLMAALGVNLYAQYSAKYVVMAAAFAALAGSSRAQGFLRKTLYAPAVVLAAWGALGHGLQYWTNRRTAQPAAWRAAQRYVAETRPAFVLFDAATLRYVFNFDPPEASADLSWSWSGGLADRWWSPARLEARDLWVVNATGLRGTSEGKYTLPPARIFGRIIASMRPSNGLVAIAGSALPEPATPFLFLRSADFHFPDQLH